MTSVPLGMSIMPCDIQEIKRSNVPDALWTLPLPSSTGSLVAVLGFVYLIEVIRFALGVYGLT